jgi:hypothetical protein
MGLKGGAYRTPLCVEIHDAFLMSTTQKGEVFV